MPEQTTAERVRNYAAERYLEPARRRGETTVQIVAGEIHKALQLRNVIPNVCQALKGPNGISTIVAMAVTTEITGAIAIIQGTAVAGVKASLESSLSTSAIGCIAPQGPTRLGPMRDWKRPRILRSPRRMSGTSCRKTVRSRP